MRLRIVLVVTLFVVLILLCSLVPTRAESTIAPIDFGDVMFENPGLTGQEIPSIPDNPELDQFTLFASIDISQGDVVEDGDWNDNDNETGEGFDESNDRRRLSSTTDPTTGQTTKTVNGRVPQVTCPAG
jgi:hypothetical protein